MIIIIITKGGYKPHGSFLGFLATFICFCVTVLFYRYLYFVVNQIKIFQGDSLYHCFLCCTWHNSERSGRELKINHLLFIDVLKLFGKSYEQIDFLVQTVHTFTMDIGMEFEIKKCGVLVPKRDKIVKMEGRNCITRWASCEGD